MTGTVTDIAAQHFLTAAAGVSSPGPTASRSSLIVGGRGKSTVYTLAMTFSKRLRDGVRRGEISCSVRIWTRPHVKAGHRYRMDEGEIEVDSIEPIGLPDITPALARESGFLGVVDLLKVAKHGKGENIYLVRFHYIQPQIGRPSD